MASPQEKSNDLQGASGDENGQEATNDPANHKE